MVHSPHALFRSAPYAPYCRDNLRVVTHVRVGGGAGSAGQH